MIIKKFAVSDYQVPKISFTDNSGDFVVTYSDQWGPELEEAYEMTGALAAKLVPFPEDDIHSMVVESVEWREHGGKDQARIGVSVYLIQNDEIVGPMAVKTPWILATQLQAYQVDPIVQGDDVIRRLRAECQRFIRGDGRAQGELELEALAPIQAPMMPVNV